MNKRMKVWISVVLGVVALILAIFVAVKSVTGGFFNNPGITQEEIYKDFEDFQHIVSYNYKYDESVVFLLEFQDSSFRDCYGVSKIVEHRFLAMKDSIIFVETPWRIGQVASFKKWRWSELPDYCKESMNLKNFIEFVLK